MQIEEKFNKRSAPLVEVQAPIVRNRVDLAPQGLKLEFYTLPEADDARTIAMHMDPIEALQLAEQLTASAREVLAKRIKDRK